MSDLSAEARLVLQLRAEEVQPLDWTEAAARLEPLDDVLADFQDGY